ncbi:hypothetical protein C1H46_006249 [Malus baccata]|uniref:Uncharacterized protein n=1 Tax=Malus baccata TaxID=106549 RepID=A0A540NC17_MALBA|nr:hypothetical protein C1H46_006249 [Malus baccata]
MASKSKIIFIGSTEKFIVYASVKASHRTYFLGDLYDHNSLVKAIEQVYVVISMVGHAQSADQATHTIEPTWVVCFEFWNRSVLRPYDSIGELPFH